MPHTVRCHTSMHVMLLCYDSDSVREQHLLSSSVRAHPGNGALSDAYRRELQDVMAYVVRLDWLDNMLPGERIHLWIVTWDASAGEFRGISSHWGPASQVQLEQMHAPLSTLT